MQRQVDAIVELLKAKIAAAPGTAPLSKIKAVFKGDPVIIGTSSLPALVVRTPNAQIGARDNVRDQRDYTVQVRYIYNIRNEMGNPNQENVGFEVTANDIFIKENNDGSLDSSCICDILRKDQSLTGVGKIQTNFSVVGEYTQVRGYLAFESSLNFTILQIGAR